MRSCLSQSDAFSSGIRYISGFGAYGGEHHQWTTRLYCAFSRRTTNHGLTRLRTRTVPTLAGDAGRLRQTWRAAGVVVCWRTAGLRHCALGVSSSQVTACRGYKGAGRAVIWMDIPRYGCLLPPGGGRRRIFCPWTVWCGVAVVQLTTYNAAGRACLVSPILYTWYRASGAAAARPGGKTPARRLSRLPARRRHRHSLGLYQRCFSTIAFGSLLHSTQQKRGAGGSCQRGKDDLLVGILCHTDERRLAGSDGTSVNNEQSCTRSVAAARTRAQISARFAAGVGDAAAWTSGRYRTLPRWATAFVSMPRRTFAEQRR